MQNPGAWAQGTENRILAKMKINKTRNEDNNALGTHVEKDFELQWSLMDPGDWTLDPELSVLDP